MTDKPKCSNPECVDGQVPARRGDLATEVYVEGDGEVGWTADDKGRLLDVPDGAFKPCPTCSLDAPGNEGGGDLPAELRGRINRQLANSDTLTLATEILAVHGRLIDEDRKLKHALAAERKRWTELKVAATSVVDWYDQHGGTGYPGLNCWINILRNVLAKMGASEEGK